MNLVIDQHLKNKVTGKKQKNKKTKFVVRYPKSRTLQQIFHNVIYGKSPQKRDLESQID